MLFCFPCNKQQVLLNFWPGSVLHLQSKNQINMDSNSTILQWQAPDGTMKFVVLDSDGNYIGNTPSEPIVLRNGDCDQKVRKSEKVALYGPLAELAQLQHPSPAGSIVASDGKKWAAQDVAAVQKSFGNDVFAQVFMPNFFLAAPQQWNLVESKPWVEDAKVPNHTDFALDNSAGVAGLQYNGRDCLMEIHGGGWSAFNSTGGMFINVSDGKSDGVPAGVTPLYSAPCTDARLHCWRNDAGDSGDKYHTCIYRVNRGQWIRLFLGHQSGTNNYRGMAHLKCRVIAYV